MARHDSCSRVWPRTRAAMGGARLGARAPDWRVGVACRPTATPSMQLSGGTSHTRRRARREGCAPGVSLRGWSTAAVATLWRTRPSRPHLTNDHLAGYNDPARPLRSSQWLDVCLAGHPSRPGRSSPHSSRRWNTKEPALDRTSSGHRQGLLAPKGHATRTAFQSVGSMIALVALPDSTACRACAASLIP
jgi:hypothetical protein